MTIVAEVAAMDAGGGGAGLVKFLFGVAMYAAGIVAVIALVLLAQIFRR